MTVEFESTYEWAYRVLTESDPDEKARLSLNGKCVKPACSANLFGIAAPDRPARPGLPKLLNPREMPRRSTGQKGKIAFVHALAHIELNAIDLAWDMILRFGSSVNNDAFIADWTTVARDEARHFHMLRRRLEEMDAAYGDLPAHDGLWEAAAKTSDDVLDRLAVIPMMLEARGIDTTPKAIDRLKGSGDIKTSTLLEEIYHDEIEHLRIGVRWFEHECGRRRLEPVSTWRTSVSRHLNSKPKQPLNYEGRVQASMDPSYWEDW